MAAKASTDKPYQHTPLGDPNKQIRLLNIQSASDSEDEAIVCDLEIYSIADNPAYRAISYVWGHDQPQCRIQVNERTVMVRTNCAYVLWQVRLYQRSAQKMHGLDRQHLHQSTGSWGEIESGRNDGRHLPECDSFALLYRG